MPVASRLPQRTRAVSFGGGVLRVEVPDARWQDQLQDLSGGYLAKLNQYSRTRVERIEFVVAASAAVGEKLREQRGQAGAQARTSECTEAGKQMAETKVTEQDVCMWPIWRIWS